MCNWTHTHNTSSGEQLPSPRHEVMQKELGGLNANGGAFYTALITALISRVNAFASDDNVNRD